MRAKLFSMLLFLVSVSFAQTITVHFKSPWVEDSVRSETPLYIISNESGWWPGKQMIPEGGGWYSYTFTRTPLTSTERIEFMSVIPTIHDAQAERVFYTGGSQQITMQKIFANNPTAKEVWITTPTLDSDAEYIFTAPECKVIYFFNPWNLGAPRILLPNQKLLRMNAEPSYCGWSSYKYFGETDSALFKFVNSIDSTVYGDSGLDGSGFIDLRAHFSTSDTAWILPTPYPQGPPTFSTTFPGTKGDCSVIFLGAVMRDINESHPDFQNEPCVKLQQGMVEERLGPNGKPVPTYIDSCAVLLDNWFLPESLGNGYTNETCYNMLLQKNDEGLFEIDNSNFFPLDDFLFLDEEETIPNPNYSRTRERNYHFTMEIAAEFEYVPGQTFYFRGDDDVWVYIDSVLVVDIGGIHGPVEGAVNLDTLGLTAGETYSFKLFFAERHCCGSNFRMVTSLNLRTSSKIFHKADNVTENLTQYEIFERITRSNLSCDRSASTTDVQKAAVDFFIEGPSFTEPKQLLSGTSYGGITISEDFSTIIVDESSVRDLLPGGYTIRYYLKSDNTQKGFVAFVVSGDPPRILNDVDSAFYYCTNGLGMVDKAEIFYSKELASLPDSISLSWPSFGQHRIIYSSDMLLDQQNPQHVTITISEPFPQAMTAFYGTDRLGISFITDEIITFSIKERIGPLITEAYLLEKDTADRTDTLILTFSEPLSADSIRGQAFIIKKTNGDEALVSISSAVQIGNSYKVVVFGPINKLDSIRINPLGSIEDFYGNKAHPQNRYINLILKPGLPKVLSGYYYDRDADGIVEEGFLKFNRAVEREEIQCTFAWSNGVMTNSLPPEKITYGKDSTELKIDLRKSFVDSTFGISSGDLYLKYSTPEYLGNGSSVLLDSAAPVLISAQLLYAENESDSDLLNITFSESVPQTFSSTPLLFSRSQSDSTYQLRLFPENNNGKIWTFRVEDYPGNIVPAKGDSVWISIDGNVSDQSGIMQLNPGNHKVPLQIQIPNAGFRISLGPNPFNPTLTRMNFYIQPQAKYKENIGYDIELIIYDPLGNVIQTISRLGLNGDSKITWNGTNQKGRIVGSGTYLCLGRLIQKTEGKTEKFKLKVFVCR